MMNAYDPLLKLIHDLTGRCRTSWCYIY